MAPETTQTLHFHPYHISNIKLYSKCKASLLQNAVHRLRWVLFGHIIRMPLDLPPQKVIKTLKDDYNLSDEDEEVFKELIDDEEGKTDHENDNVPFRLQVMQVFERLQVLSDEELERVKSVFIKRMGEEATQQIFDEAYRIYMSELPEIDDLAEELWVDEEEAEAFEIVVEDVETGADPMEEDEKTQYGIEELATDVMNLPPDLQQRFRALLFDTFGEEQARALLDEINEIRNAIDSKIEDPWLDEAAEEAIDEEEEDKYARTNHFFKKLGVNVSEEDSFWDYEDDGAWLLDQGEDFRQEWGGEKQMGEDKGDVDENGGVDGKSGGEEQVTDGWSGGAEQVADGKSGGEEQVTDGESGGEEQVTYGESGGEEQVADGWSGVADQVADGESGGEEQVAYGESGGADQVAYGESGGEEQVTDGLFEDLGSRQSYQKQLEIRAR
uniref:Uncharacterized protein n=1 Tax=Branchiostoma floridae TaxID=7739 RepID=C3ZTL8_BRAFL|eukprot:XP_002588114.1 hypothetical protein BRAFLDRAFT_87634 [Branchiostoma floridae]